MLTIILIVVSIFAALYMAWNIGANDVANSMATAVGAKAISLRQALIVASILNVCGAVLVGKHVTTTIQGKIVDTALLTDHSLILGFLSALLAAGIFVTFATWKELPVSTTHGVIGGVIGFGLIEGGIDLVIWVSVVKVAASWMLSPVAGAVIAFITFKIIAYLVFGAKNPLDSAKKIGPVFIALTLFIILVSIFSKTNVGEMLGYTTNEYIIFTIIISLFIGIIGFFIFKNILGEGYDIVERLFRRLQVMTSCYVAFSQGANDVANAVAPVSVILLLTWGKIETTYLLLLGGIGIAIGITTWGYKVIRTVGEKITILTNTRGFSIEFGAATVVLVASKLGLPISTSHTVVGAVIGVGLARGLEAVDLSVVKRIVYSWALTLPVTILLAIVIYKGLQIIF